MAAPPPGAGIPMIPLASVTPGGPGGPGGLGGLGGPGGPPIPTPSAGDSILQKLRAAAKLPTAITSNELYKNLILSSKSFQDYVSKSKPSSSSSSSSSSSPESFLVKDYDSLDDFVKDFPAFPLPDDYQLFAVSTKQPNIAITRKAEYALAADITGTPSKFPDLATKSTPDYYQKQESAGCGRHALNNLLGFEVFSKGKAADAGSKTLDQIFSLPIPLQEVCGYLHSVKTTPEDINTFCPENENYLLDVLEFALNMLGYNLTPITDFDKPAVDEGSLFHTNNSAANVTGFLVHLPGHWSCLRKIGTTFRYLDSLASNKSKLSLPKGEASEGGPVKNLMKAVTTPASGKYNLSGYTIPVFTPDELAATREKISDREKLNQTSKNILSEIKKLWKDLEKGKAGDLNGKANKAALAYWNTHLTGVFDTTAFANAILSAV